MNYSIDNTTTDPPFHGNDERPFAQVVLQTTAMACIIVGSTFGNILILLAVYFNYQLREITSVYIVNLACADFFLAVVGMPLTLVSSVTYEWVFGEKLCVFQGFLNFIFCAASILSLTSISIERYIAIIKPMRYPYLMTQRTVTVMIVYIWCHPFIGSLLGLSSLGWSRYTYYPMESLCIFDWAYSASFTVFILVSSFFAPLSVLIYCYFHILRAAHRQSNRVQTCGTFSEVPPPLAAAATTAAGVDMPIPAEDPQEKIKRTKAQKKLKKETKAAKILLLVIGTFVFCWTPHMIGIICLLFPSIKLPDDFFTMTTWLGMLNSACNPVIYGVRNTRFRNSFKKILCCGKKVNQIAHLDNHPKRQFAHDAPANQCPK